MKRQLNYVVTNMSDTLRDKAIQGAINISCTLHKNYLLKFQSDELEVSMGQIYKDQIAREMVLSTIKTNVIEITDYLRLVYFNAGTDMEGEISKYLVNSESTECLENVNGSQA